MLGYLIEISPWKKEVEEQYGGESGRMVVVVVGRREGRKGVYI